MACDGDVVSAVLSVENGRTCVRTVRRSGVMYCWMRGSDITDLWVVFVMSCGGKVFVESN